MMTNKHSEPTTHAAPARESLGGLLRQSRESQGKSLEEAAAVTRISQRTLLALESDDFSGRPAEVFTRGFVKIYAEYLRIDPSAALQLYVAQENLDPDHPVDRPYRHDILCGTAMARPLHFLKDNPRLRILAILLAVLLSFYTLGAIIKSCQKHPSHGEPENEVAKSLVEGKPQPLPAQPGEAQLPSRENTPDGAPANPAAPGLSGEGTPNSTAQSNPAEPPLELPPPTNALSPKQTFGKGAQPKVTPANPSQAGSAATPEAAGNRATTGVAVPTASRGSIAGQPLTSQTFDAVPGRPVPNRSAAPVSSPVTPR